MKRKGANTTKPLAREPTEQFARVYRSMMESPAFNKLSALQIRLYLQCQTWSYSAGARMRVDPERYPRDAEGRLEKIRDNDFYANFAKAISYGIVKRTNKDSFYKAINKLVELGFIDCVIDGNSYYKKCKSVYRLSERWKSISA